MRIESYIEPHWASPHLQGHMILCEECGHRFKIDLGCICIPEGHQLACPRCLAKEAMGPVLSNWRKRLVEAVKP